jgi:hypothetical protein
LAVIFDPRRSLMALIQLPGGAGAVHPLHFVDVADYNWISTSKAVAPVSQMSAMPPARTIN